MQMLFIQAMVSQLKILTSQRVCKQGETASNLLDASPEMIDGMGDKAIGKRNNEKCRSPYHSRF